MSKVVSLLLILVSTNSFAATVYKCEVNGKVVFSQMPCVTGSSANETMIYSDKRKQVNNAIKQSNQPEKATSSPNAFLLTQKKQRSQSKIALLKRQQNDEMESVKEKLGLESGKNRIRRGQVQFINSELSEVQDKYKKKIEQEEERLSQIEKDISGQG